MTHRGSDSIREAALRALGMPVPDSAFARRAREVIDDVAAVYLVNHSIRSYAWAVGLAWHDGLEFDPEILYVSAALHDIGLVPEYDLGGCFELDGADAAQRFAIAERQPMDRARAIYDVIALHMADELPPDSAPEVRLLWDSTGTDVSGERLEDVKPSLVAPVVAAYPRLTFKRDFAAAFADQAAMKPTCTAAAMVAEGMLAAIENAPFES
jgi:hypothetical protein